MSDDKKSDVRRIAKMLTDDFEFHHEDVAKPSIIHVILLNRTLRILCALGVFCMLIPILDYFYFYSTEIAEYQNDDSGICSHYPIYQIPCGGGGRSENITELECIENACCYSITSGCYHFLPSRYQLRADKSPWSASEFLKPTRTVSPFNTNTFASMKLDIEQVSDEILSIFLWNPMLVSHQSADTNPITRDSKYDVKIFSPELFIEVRRKIDNQTILSTARGALIASENYFEWSVHLGGSDIKLMGFDTTHLTEGQRILINNAHSSVIPYVFAYDVKSKYYHGVYFESINSPAEIQIQKSNTIIIRQYSSASFGMKIFTGPSYVDIYRQLKSNRTSYFPSEYWAFGIHYCRSNSIYNESETKIELNQLIMNLETLPFDSYCIDSDLTATILSIDNDIFNDYESIIEKLRIADKKLFLHITLGVINANNDILDKLFLLTNDDNQVFIGMYGKTHKVFYLDYITKSVEIAELLMQYRNHHFNNIFNMSDAFLLYRNFPFDDTINKPLSYLEKFNFKPSDSENFLNEIEHLIPLNVRLSNGEPLIHQLNNFGRRVIEVFQQSLNDDGKKFCIADAYRETTSSESCGMLMRVERPSWTNFQATIHKSVFYSLIGMSFYGTEVCGGGGTIAEDLCIRWYQFAIFMPLFYANSNRMPTKFTKYAERIMLHAIRTRYALLSYVRTCMLMKIPLLRPLRYAYPDNDNLIELISNQQLMFGDALMISPIMEPLVDEVNLYFPEKFYDMWSGVEMPHNVPHFSIVMHDIPIFIRAGHIIALNLAYESVSMSAEDARLQPYLVIVALSCVANANCHAVGRQNIVDGVDFKFEASEIHLNITVITTSEEEEEGKRSAICGPERFASSEFRFAKIYGMGEFKEKHRNSNDYLSLDLNICDADWNEIFSISI